MSYSTTSEIAAKGEALVGILLDKRGLKVRWVPYIENTPFAEFQYTKGDCIVYDGDEKYPVEVKTEKADKYDNFFIETWSHKQIGRPGWLYNLTTTRHIYYVFLRERLIYVLDFAKLKALDISGYEEKPQSKYEQDNDTWGRPVPIEHLRAAGIIVHTYRMKPEIDSDTAKI
jgi:hypothetical protein